MNRTRTTIEFPARGATYCHQEFGVYEYGTYPRHSVLAGQTSRRFLGSYETLREAQSAHPGAKAAEGCGFRAPSLNHLPGED